MPKPLRLLLKLTALLWCATAQAQGITVAIGGALQDDNVEIWQALADAVRSGPADAACYGIVTLASAEPEAAAMRVAANLQRHGVPARHVRAGAEPAELLKCRGVFMTGGAQARLLDVLLPSGREGPWLQALRKVWLQGGVVAGTSAGAAVLSSVVFRDAPDVLAVMQGRQREGKEWQRGLAFTPAGVVVDQHAVRRGRLGRLLPLMLAQQQTLGVAVEENSAAWFQGSSLRALGARGVLLADLAQANGRAAPLQVQGGLLHWLESGDRFDLPTRTVHPSPRKQAGTRLEPLAPTHKGYHRGAWFYADMLGEGTIVAALSRLVDGDQRELRGLAFAGPGSDVPDPALAFEWRFTLAPGTHAWLALKPEGYTVVGAKFDIVPVRVQQPLYSPLPPQAR